TLFFGRAQQFNIATAVQLRSRPPPNLRVRFLPIGDEPDVRNWRTNGRAEEARLGQFVKPCTTGPRYDLANPPRFRTLSASALCQSKKGKELLCPPVRLIV